MRVVAPESLVQEALHLVNLVRTEVGDEPLSALPSGSMQRAEHACLIARAFSAIVLIEEQRIVFCYEWHATAAAKLWRMPFRDVLLMSVELPRALLEFSVAFRSGAFPDLLEVPAG